MGENILKFEIGDIVHARDTQDWYGFVTNVIGTNAYVKWFDREYERNGWFQSHMLYKVS
jgi:N6-adenosine-specific RNA methylase IME4